VEDNAVIALSGSAAEEIILGKRYTSSMDDFTKARRNIFFLLWGIGAYGIEFAGFASSQHGEQPLSTALAEKGELICSEKLKEFYNESTNIISENKDLVELIAHSLVEKSTLSKDDLLSLYKMKEEQKGA
jgi:ATP-dependent Zn protease